MNTESRTELNFALDIDFSDILTNPILDIAARFWADDRYEAFRACYRSMRVVDDLVDDRKASGIALSDDERREYTALIERWTEALRAGQPVDDFQKGLIEIMSRFRIPRWPWEKLARAMTYDLYHDGFASFHVFLRYAEGAAISPASVFMHLCGVRNDGDNLSAPSFDIRRAARPLAVFSYLVHILRDFQKDQLRGLNYFADNVMRECGADREQLRRAARGDISPSVRELIARYRDFAEYYRTLARGTLDGVLPLLESRYQLSLEIIYSLYLQIYERVNPETGNFTEAELNPAPKEVQARIDSTVEQFGVKSR